MSPLSIKQHKFILALAKLIQYADSLGYILSIGDAYRDPRVFGELGETKGYGTSKSCHKVRLAVDLNVKDSQGNMAPDSAHEILHQFWITLGGSLSVPGDLNHYSFTHEGMR